MLLMQYFNIGSSVKSVNTYACDDGVCKQKEGGPYTSMSACEEHCTDEKSDSDSDEEEDGYTFDCVSNMCIAVDGKNGTYASLQKCNANCGKETIIVPARPYYPQSLLAIPPYYRRRIGRRWHPETRHRRRRHLRV